MLEKEPYEATKGQPMTRKKAKRLKLKVREGLSLMFRDSTNRKLFRQGMK